MRDKRESVGEVKGTRGCNREKRIRSMNEEKPYVFMSEKHDCNEECILF